jgi:hypothetical protein
MKYLFLYKIKKIKKTPKKIIKTIYLIKTPLKLIPIHNNYPEILQQLKDGNFEKKKKK